MPWWCACAPPLGVVVSSKSGEHNDVSKRVDASAEDSLGPQTIVDQEPPDFLTGPNSVAAALKAPVGDVEATTGTGSSARQLWGEETALDQGTERPASIPTAGGDAVATASGDAVATASSDAVATDAAMPELDVGAGATLVDFRLPLGGAVPREGLTPTTGSEEVTTMESLPDRFAPQVELVGPQDETAVMTFEGPGQYPSPDEQEERTLEITSPEEPPAAPSLLQDSLPGVDVSAIADREDVTQFGEYLLFGQVGVGGMAEVLLACQLGVRGFIKPCVIKRIVPALAQEVELRELLREEARVNRQLNHRGIVRLYEYDEVEGVPYLAMELVDGVNLATLDVMAGDNGLPLTIVMAVARHVAAALDYAHSQTDEGGRSLNIIHRDVSPQNILLSRSGEVKLADFGIARFAGREHQTSIGPPKGKLRYMAPEQLRYQRFDHRIDIFALGIVIVELLHGRAVLPNGALVVDDLEALIRERLADSRTRLPAGLVELLVRMTRVDADDRPSAVAKVGEALEAVHESLADRTSLGDYAADLIAPSVPSAEDAIFSLLVPSSATEDLEPSEPSSSARVLKVDLTQTIDGDEGFPTTSHFMLSAEAPLTSSEADRLVSAADWQGEVTFAPEVQEDVPDTHLRLPAYDDEQEQLSDRGESAFGATYIRPNSHARTAPPTDQKSDPPAHWAAPFPKGPVVERTTAGDDAVPTRPVAPAPVAPRRRSGPRPVMVAALLIAALGLGIGVAFLIRPLVAYFSG